MRGLQVSGQTSSHELCVLCFENPKEPSVFMPCGHGLDYCNSCMTESLKSRETTTEYQLDDGQIEYHTTKIPSKKNVQNVGKEIAVYRNYIRENNELQKCIVNIVHSKFINFNCYL